MVVTVADFASGEVVGTPGGVAPYCAIFRVHDEVLFRWPVHSIAEGEVRIGAALEFLSRQIDGYRAIAPALMH